MICIGLNYADHAAESGMDVPKQPIFFTKFASSIIGPGEAVVHPGDDVTTQLDYEVELAFIIGRGGKDIPEEEAWTASSATPWPTTSRPETCRCKTANG